MATVKVIERSPGMLDYQVLISVSPDEMMGGKLDLNAAMADAAKELARQYVAEHATEVLKALDPVAITNLAIAQSATMVREQFIDPKPTKGTK